jgi:hypothetical protein
MRVSRVVGTLFGAVLAVGTFGAPAHAGVGCDINIRVNNKTPRALTVYGSSQSSAAAAGTGLWSPLSGMSDASLAPEGTSGSHSRQAVELETPCWTGNRDFKIKYLDGTVDKWKYRYGVSVSAGDTIQINLP